MPDEIDIPPGTTRAAVVIGVDRTGLPKLDGAASGALAMGDWLREEGYHVTAHTDGPKTSVTRAEIFKTVTAYSKAATIEKLVIYFAGHGFYSSGNEIWLLSGAPDDSSEAINLKVNEELARMTQLRHVIFIADTCRSLPTQYEMQMLKGANIFPTVPLGGTCEVDTFFATLVGLPALEVALDEAMKEYEGLFTKTLIDLHKSAEPTDLVQTVIDGSDAMVFPNRRLKKRLPAAFSETARQLNIRKRQTPSLRIESDEPVHVARGFVPAAPAAMPSPVGAPMPVPMPAPMPGFAGSAPPPVTARGIPDTFERAARKMFKLDAVPPIPEATEPEQDPTLMRLAEEARAQMAPRESAHFETRSGAIVIGMKVKDAVPIGPFGIDNEGGDSGQTRLRFKNHPDYYGPLSTPFSAIIRFEDGTGTIVAALPGFVAALQVHEGRGVTSVSYTPAEGTMAWDEYSHFREEVNHRRAMAATAAQHGVLALDRKDAVSFGDRIRVGKSVDPTLGIYAALAYAGVGLRDQAKSVLSYMQSDMHANLFDPWLLAGGDPGDLSEHLPRVPICPMLSQSWDYLAPFGVDLPSVLDNAGRFPALWTTFLPTAMDAIIKAAHSGELS